MNQEMQNIYNELQEIAEELDLNQLSEFDSYMNADSFNELDDELDSEFGVVSLDQTLNANSFDLVEDEFLEEEELFF